MVGRNIRLEADNRTRNGSLVRADGAAIRRPDAPETVQRKRIVFQRVPDGKTAKNRLHLDLRPKDQAAEVARLEALGARRVDVGQGTNVSWVVLADPDGNEFDVLKPLTRADAG